MKSFLKAFTVCVVLPFVLFSCDDDDNYIDSSELENVALISTATVSGYTIELYSEDALTTGYNNLYFRVLEGSDVTDISEMSIMPVMHMTMMDHAAPYSQPTRMEGFEDYFAGYTVFIMPSGEMGTWDIEFDITTMANETISGMFEAVTVASSWRLTSVTSENDQNYYVTWYAPENPKTGDQELTVMVHKRENMMSFPAVVDAEVTIYPWMDMGGGSGHSTNFEEPVAMGEGMYTGSINYSMSGTWTTEVTVVDGDETIGTVLFEYSVIAQ